MNIIIFSSTEEIIGFARNYGAYAYANTMRAKGYSCLVVENFKKLDFKEACKIIDDAVDLKMVGFSSTFFREYPAFPHSDNWMKDFVEYIKSKNKNIELIYGGVKSNRWKDKIPFIDRYVIGYADNFNIPFQWINEDNIRKGECLPIEFGRGCYNKCPYCNFRKPKLQYKPIEDIRKELITNYERWNITKYFLVDSNLPHYERMLEVDEMIRSLPFQIKYGCYGNLKLFYEHPHLMDKLERNGCTTISFGIESLNPDTLKAINKYIDIWDQRDLLQDLKKRFFISGGFIAGLPYENEESIRKTMDWLLSDDCPLDESIYFPLWIPKDKSIISEFRDNADKWGYDVNGRWISKTSDMNEGMASNMCYEFMNREIKPCVNYTIPFRLQNIGVNCSYTESKRIQ